MSRQSLTIVIPVLNEAGNLDALIARLKPVLESLGKAWDVLFIDDGSSDGTLARLREIHAADSRIRAVALSRNFGKELALAAGLRYATGDAAIMIDADLQHPPELMREFVAKWDEGYEIVYGQRADRKTDGVVRRTLARGFYASFHALSRTPIPDGAGDFRLLDRKAIDAMNRLSERERFNKGLYSWIGFRSIGVPYDVAERHEGRGKWGARRLLHFALDGITSFSTVPLRIWSYLGLLISLVALVYSVYVLVWTLVFGADLPGFPTIVISIMFFSGVQLISLGVIGEYLGRVYEEVKGRPLYVVSEEIGVAERRGVTDRRQAMPSVPSSLSKSA